MDMKTAVIGGMPVLGGYHHREERHQAVDDRDDLSRSRDRQFRLPDEAVLHVHYQ